jgi:hypothetical protein
MSSKVQSTAGIPALTPDLRPPDHLNPLYPLDPLDPLDPFDPLDLLRLATVASTPLLHAVAK